MSGTAFRIQAVTAAAFSGRTFRFLLAAEIDPEKDTVKLAGIDPGSGALLFKSSGDPREEPRFTPLFAERLPAALRAFPAVLAEDLRRIFMVKKLSPLDVEKKGEYIFIRSQENVFWKVEKTGAALERRAGSFFSGRWSADYREKGRRIAYRRNGPGPGYSLELSVKQILVK